MHSTAGLRSHSRIKQTILRALVRYAFPPVTGDVDSFLLCLYLYIFVLHTINAVRIHTKLPPIATFFNEIKLKHLYRLILRNLPSKYQNWLTTSNNNVMNNLFFSYWVPPNLSIQKHTSKRGANRTLALKTKENVDIVLKNKYTFQIQYG